MDDDKSSNTKTEATPWQYTPGESISPGSGPDQTASDQAHVSIPQPEAATISDSNADADASSPLPAPSPVSAPQQTRGPSDMVDSGDAITWSASEYVAHQKTAGWYILLVIAGLVLAAIVYLIMRDIISTGVIVLATVLFAVYGAHKPRVLQYRLDADGISIGNGHFVYAQFRSFSVVEDGAFSSVSLMPLKRFMPIVTVHFDPKDEDEIVGTLAERLPMEPGHKDPVDRLLQRIRF